MEPARIPGHGSVPAPFARARLRGPTGTSRGEPSGRARGRGSPASVWLHRLYTTPDGRDLVAMDSRRRVFTGLLRRMLVLRDDVCATPAHPAREGGATSLANGDGRCARCNHTKEAPGWIALVDAADGAGVERLERLDGPARAGPARRQRELVTPLGRRYRSEPPPLLGWGSTVPSPIPASGPMAGSRRPRPRPSHDSGRRPADRRSGRSRQPHRPRRPRVRSHLERGLCRLVR